MNEALRYFKNAKKLLGKSPVVDDTYTDIKYVQEACGTIYLAVLKAIDKYLLSRGVSERELPQSVDGYRKMIKKHLPKLCNLSFRQHFLLIGKISWQSESAGLTQHQFY